MSRPAVTVIIPARDAEPTLPRTLKALEEQTLAEPFEVIVVDDASRDGTATIAAAYAPLVTVLTSPRAEGPGAARNRGAEAARGRVLAFTDADCFPAPQWLREGLAAVERAALVQGRVVPDPTTVRTVFDRSLQVDSDGGFYQTANLFVRRELFDAVGGFRDWALERPRRWSADRRRGRATRTPIGEDTLFAYNARRVGADSCFAGSAIVHHAVVPGTFSDAAADRWHWTRDMPGLVRLVPELRDDVLHRRWFFADWTARFDLALAAVLLAVATGRALPLVLTGPYLALVCDEAASLPGDGRVASAINRRGRALIGRPLLDAVGLAGFAAGAREWRSLVL